MGDVEDEVWELGSDPATVFSRSVCRFLSASISLCTVLTVFLRSLISCTRSDSSASMAGGGGGDAGGAAGDADDESVETLNVGEGNVVEGLAECMNDAKCDVEELPGPEPLGEWLMLAVAANC